MGARPRMLSIAKLLEEWPGLNPFVSDPWEIGRAVTREEVAAAVEDGTHALASEPWTTTPRDRPPESFREYHAQRIAHLAVSGWTEPVEIDLGIPSMAFRPDHPLTDGHHRLAAAIFLGHRGVLADCAGEVRWIRRFDLEPRGGAPR